MSSYHEDVSLIKEKGVKMVQKIMRISESSITPDTKYPLWREIEFGNFAKDYSDYFQTLHKYSIDYDCGHKQKKPAWLVDKKEIAEWQKLQSSPYCVTFLYTPVLENTLSHLYQQIDPKYKINRNTGLYPMQMYKLTFQMMFQRLYILYLLLKNDWIHKDAYSHNWSYKKTNETLVFGDYKVSCPYKLYLCNYGTMIHRSHNIDPKEEKKFNFDERKYLDIINNITEGVPDPMGFWLYEERNSRVFPDLTSFYKLVKKSPLAKNIKYKKTGYPQVDLHIFMILFQLKYYKEYYRIFGFDVENEKYAYQLVEHTDWEYSIYKHLTNFILEPKKLFKFLHTLC